MGGGIEKKVGETEKREVIREREGGERTEESNINGRSLNISPKEEDIDNS